MAIPKNLLAGRRPITALVPRGGAGALFRTFGNNNPTPTQVQVQPMPTYTQTAVGQAAQLRALGERVAQLSALVEGIARYVVQDAGEPVQAARVAEGYSMYSQPDENGKGGIIWADPGAFGIADPLGTIVTVEVAGIDHARLTSTVMRAVQFVLSGGIQDLTEAAKIVCSLKLNGMTHNRFNRVPLDFAPGPGGVIVTTMPIPQGIYIPPDTFVELEYETVAALTTTTAGQVEARIMAGE
jgi:hypothetical protein